MDRNVLAECFLSKRKGGSMGKADITMNECLADGMRYADCFNTAVGERLILPERLEKMERIEEGSIPLPRTVAYYKKERDGVQAVRNPEGILCAIVCMENQTDIHYAEAVRQFILDAYSYNKQLTDIRKRHEAEERVKDQLADIRKQDEAEERTKDQLPDIHKQDGAEGRTKDQLADICKLDKPEGEIEEQVKGQENRHCYQGFTPADRLIPAVTVCVYYGREPWNAPIRLIDLMDFSGFTKKEARHWRKYIQDYRIRVLDIRRMPDEQIEDMSSDLKLLFGMLKNSEDKETLQGYIHQHEQEMDVIKEDLAEAFAVLSGTAGLRKYLKKNKGDKEGGTIRMCKEIQTFGFSGTSKKIYRRIPWK